MGRRVPQNPRKGLFRNVPRRHTPIFFARYRLKGFKAEFVQTLRRALFKSIWTWAHPPYDQKMIKTQCFRCDFVMVLDGTNYQKSRNIWQNLALQTRRKVASRARITNTQPPRKVLLEGLRWRSMFKIIVGYCLKSFGCGPSLYVTKKCSKRSVFDTISKGFWTGIYF